MLSLNRTEKFAALVRIVMSGVALAATIAADIPASADTGKIVFDSDRDGSTQIYVMNGDGTNQSRLTFTDVVDDHPVFSSDGSKIAFVSARNGLDEIYIMNSNGSGQTRLTNNSATESSPMFSPDGSKIVFLSDRDGSQKIYIMDSDGANATVIPNTTASDNEPSFSSDGTKILFRTTSGPFNQIYTMDLDGSNRVQVVNSNRWDEAPIYNSTGSKIAFMSSPSSSYTSYEIAVMDANGSNRTFLTSNSLRDSFPRFSPDSSQLVFNTFGQSWQIHTINSDGTSETTLTSGTQNRNPYWGPGAVSDKPSLNIGDATVIEGDSGTTNASFTVTLSAAVNFPVVVNYATADGTPAAKAGTDYTATSGTLTIPGGQTTGTITVPIQGDTIDENDEYFVVNLSNAINGTITDTQGQGTLSDNDAPPGISIGDISLTEGNTSKSMIFTVTLNSASSLSVSVDYATADGTAIAGSDYTTTSGTHTFSPGQTSKTITVPIAGDVLDEDDETLFVNLSNSLNSTIQDSQAKGTLVDNDESPSLRINDITVPEGPAPGDPATQPVPS